MKTSLGQALLTKAASENEIDVSEARLIRNGSHVMWDIPGGIVGRIGERGSEDVSVKEVAVSQWLNRLGIRAVRAVEGLATQPTIVDGYPITWWELLPEHRPASPAELGLTLRRLHSIAGRPDVVLPEFSVFGSARQHLEDLSGFDQEVTWILGRMDSLERRFLENAPHLPVGVIHGDAWQGNVAVSDGVQDPVILDLEAFCVGPTYWDLIPIAVDYTDFSRISSSEYEDFVATYGMDVTRVPEFRTMADIQEIRWASYVLGKAEHNSAEAVEARHRIACLRGEVPRPWKWVAF